jgi:hypothetical protein
MAGMRASWLFRLISAAIFHLLLLAIGCLSSQIAIETSAVFPSGR